MKICFAVEFYHPALGGAQEVVRRVAERLAGQGHEVWVATSCDPMRTFDVFNGVHIAQFAVSGNSVEGLRGDLAGYRAFVSQPEWDVLCIYAAQQWSLDALLPMLDEVTAAKILIPCGFSALGRRTHIAYFEMLARLLGAFDLLIFHTTQASDYRWVRSQGFTELLCIPNGADIAEFDTPIDTGFRARHGIAEQARLILTVGSVTGGKGHLELAQAVPLLPASVGEVHVLLNGNVLREDSGWSRFKRELKQSHELGGIVQALKYVVHCLGRGRSTTAERDPLDDACRAVRSEDRRVVRCNLPRQELVQAYLNADVFVLASSFEYSPLVLFEACAAGTPFLSSPAGNAAEIALWTQAGQVFEAEADIESNRLVIRPEAIAVGLLPLLSDSALCDRLGAAGRKAARDTYNWDMLAPKYEAAFQALVAARAHKKN